MTITSTETPPDARDRLVVAGLTKHYGGVKALSDVSFELAPGQTLGVIGPNGAGKSTLLALLAGGQPTSGSVTWRGQPLAGIARHRVPRMGIGRARQIPRPFRRLTVRQNLEVPANAAFASREQRVRVVDRTLDQCGLLGRQHKLAGELGLLDLKRLEVARALALEPKLLLLDEVAAGLMGHEIEAITGLIARIKAAGTSIVLVEHVPGVIGRLADRAIVLDWGRLIAEGDPQEVAADPRVVEVYFGTAEAAKPPAAAAPDKASTPAANVLQVSGLTVRYGGLTALSDVNLTMNAGQVVGIVGANGAGKTTLCKAILGLVPSQTGKVELFGRDISGLPAHKRARAGLAICHEGRRLFGKMTVRENLELGAAFSGAGSAATAERLERIFAMFPILKERARGLASAMSGGQQQMLAIGRALMAQPKVLLLDELSLGLAPKVIEGIYEALGAIRASGVNVMLIEQNTHRCLAVSDQVYVLERGRISYAGPPAKLIEDDVLHAAYFGGAAAEAKR